MTDLDSQEITISIPDKGKTWDELIASFPSTHILQTWEWGQVKSAYGWKPVFKTWYAKDGRPKAAAMILERSVIWRGLRLPLRVLYVPKGPLATSWEEEDLCKQVYADLIDLGRRRKAIFIKIDPDIDLGYGIPGSPDDRIDPVGNRLAIILQNDGWAASDEQIQFRNTVMIDLKSSEAELLQAMKQKTRYNLRLAGRKGVHVREAGRGDLDRFYQMYAETALRDGFVIRDREYYLYLWTTFFDSGMAKPLLAETEGQAIAGMILFVFADVAWFMFGMSREAHRDKMPNYLLQWEAIKWAKAAGCLKYDLWGAPDAFNEADPLWGVYRFKEGLGGSVVRKFGAWDFPLKPQLYRSYTQILPRLLEIMRRRGTARIRDSLVG